jgi:hypothetical protein
MAATAAVPSSATPCIKPPPNATPKSYHAFNFLTVFHPKYGKKPKFVPFFLENLVRQAPIFSAFGNSLPVLYRLTDEKNNINQLIEVKLRTPAMKSAWGISSGPSKAGDANQPKDKKPRFTLALNYETSTPEQAAYFELRRDMDELALRWQQEDGSKWYANVPSEVKMGSMTLKREDYLAGLFKGATRERVSVDKLTGAQRIYPAQENQAIKQKNGKFSAFLAFDVEGTVIDPLSITRDAIVQSMNMTKGLYFMPAQWGWSIECLQVQKLADGVMTECMVDADRDDGCSAAGPAQFLPAGPYIPQPASAFEEDAAMVGA